MAGFDNKLRILYMEKIFYTLTDEEHGLTLKDIGVILKQKGFNENKNTIRDDIEALRLFGMDIIHEKGKGYKLVNRLFDNAEIKLISDSIASYKFVTEEKSTQLQKKMCTFCSVYEADLLHREFHVMNRVKTDNKQILINIDAITTAIRENKQFSFEYYDYDINKNMVYNGTRECSPWEMAVSNEEYYVISYYTKYPTHLTNFRIDRMKNIQIIEDSRIKIPKELDIGSYLKSSFSMFSGKEEIVTLRFPMTNKMCNVIYDKFGYDTRIRADGEAHYVIRVPIKTEQPKAFFSWLALFEGSVQIIEPIDLAQEFWVRMELLSYSISQTIKEVEEKNHRISSDDNSVDTR